MDPIQVAVGVASVVICFIGLAAAIMWGIKAWGYRVGGRRFDTYEKFLEWTANAAGLPCAINGSFEDTRFEGRTESGRLAQVYYQKHVVSTGKSTSVYYTVHLAVAADPAVSLEVTREGILSRVGSWLGLVHDQKVGDETFDKRFWVKSDDEKKTVRAMHGGLQKIVECLFDVEGVQRLDIAEGWIQVQTREEELDPAEYHSVLTLLDDAARTFDRVPIVVHALGGERRALSDERGGTRCAYCHGGITGSERDLVACDRCHTVLHDECWRELGRCPLLGCAGRSPERARAR